jgi:hypothetical protein
VLRQSPWRARQLGVDLGFVGGARRAREQRPRIGIVAAVMRESRATQRDARRRLLVAS